MPLHVYTAQLGTYQGPDALDVTIKSSTGLGRVFAPTRWDMVMGVKRGRVNQEAYQQWYLDVLRDSYRRHRQEWDTLLSRRRVVLLCYCPPGAFCHRLILADVLGKLGAELRGELPPRLEQRRRQSAR